MKRKRQHVRVMLYLGTLFVLCPACWLCFFPGGHVVTELLPPGVLLLCYDSQSWKQMKAPHKK